MKSIILAVILSFLWGGPAHAGPPKEPDIEDLYDWRTESNRMVVLIFSIDDKLIEFGHAQQEIMEKPDICPLKFSDDLFIYVVADTLLYRIRKDPIMWREQDTNWEGVIEKTWP